VNKVPSKPPPKRKEINDEETQESEETQGANVKTNKSKKYLVLYCFLKISNKFRSLGGKITAVPRSTRD